MPFETEGKPKRSMLPKPREDSGLRKGVIANDAERSSTK